MIEKKTVLILGAGASYSYNYPLGIGLKQKIVELVSLPDNIRVSQKKVDLHSKLANNEDRVHFLVNNCNISLEAITQFRNEFRISPVYSIDAFLQNRKEFLRLGKILIVLSILSCEDFPSLFQTINYSTREHSWYTHLFNTINNDWQSFDKNNLSIITYNYDRSLEYFLITSLAATYGKSFSECVGKVNTMPIVHLHGIISKITETELPKPYDGNVNAKDIMDTVNKLHIISEEDELIDSYRKANYLIQQADQIFILGFGYDKRNLDRLKIPSNKRIYSSRTGMSDLRVQELSDLTERRVMFGTQSEAGIYRFLTEDVSLLGKESHNFKSFNVRLRVKAV